MDDFPSNSHAIRKAEAVSKPLTEEQKREDPQKIVLDPVVTGKVIRRKKSMFSRVSENLFRGESSVFGYVLQEVLVPALKDMATSMVTQGIEKALYGEVRTPRGSHRPYSTPGRPHTDYSARSTTIRPTGVQGGRRPVVQPSATNVDDIVVETLIEAQGICDALWNICNEYGSATVGHLNNLIRQSSVYTDHNFGWTDLTQMTARRVPGGYLLILPPIETLR